MTERELAALALAAQAVVQATSAQTTALAEAAVAQAAVEAAAVQAAAEAAAQVAADTEAARVAEVAQAAVAPDVVSFLQGQVKEKDAQILDLTVKARDLEIKASGMEVTHEPLAKIVRDSLNTMRVALKGSVTDLAGLSDVELLRQHAATQADFLAQFKVGGVAATAAASKDSDLKVAAVTPQDTAKITAVRFGKR